MASNKHTLTLRVPDELKHRLERLSAQQGVSINHLAVYALTKEIGELETSEHLRRFVGEVDKKRLFAEVDRILSKVPDRPVPEWDELPQ
jgi:predicted DNA-binding protein